MLSGGDLPPLVGGFSQDDDCAVKIPLHSLSLISVQLYSSVSNNQHRMLQDKAPGCCHTTNCLVVPYSVLS